MHCHQCLLVEICSFKGKVAKSLVLMQTPLGPESPPHLYDMSVLSMDHHSHHHQRACIIIIIIVISIMILLIMMMLILI